MFNNFLLERNPIIYEKRQRLKKSARKRAKKKQMLFLIMSLGITIVSSLFIANSMYIHSNSKDLEFAVEHDLTTGFSSKNKLLRVQKMSLVYFDGETAVVEASGLAKTLPHKSTSIKGSFKKDSNNSWYLDNLISS